VGVYHDINGNGVLESGEPRQRQRHSTLAAPTTLESGITATDYHGCRRKPTASGTDAAAMALAAGTYQVVETQPSGYLLGPAAVGTSQRTADGTGPSANQDTSIVGHRGQSGINYNFGDVQPVTSVGWSTRNTNGNGALDSGEEGICQRHPDTERHQHQAHGSITAATTTAGQRHLQLQAPTAPGNALRPAPTQIRRYPSPAVPQLHTNAVQARQRAGPMDPDPGRQDRLQSSGHRPAA